MLRGGYWDGTGNVARCAYRVSISPADAFGGISLVGFRAVLAPGQ